MTLCPVRHPSTCSMGHKDKDKGVTSLFQWKKLPSGGSKQAESHSRHSGTSQVSAGRDLLPIYLPYFIPSPQFMSGGCRSLLWSISHRIAPACFNNQLLSKRKVLEEQITANSIVTSLVTRVQKCWVAGYVLTLCLPRYSTIPKTLCPRPCLSGQETQLRRQALPELCPLLARHSFVDEGKGSDSKPQVYVCSEC